MINNNSSNSESAEQFITILEAPITPTLGTVEGRILDLTMESGVDKENKPFKRLSLVGGLNEKNETGEPFKGSRTWNLLGRGATDFCKEVSAFTGKKVTTNDLRQFKKSVLVNQPARFEVKERREGRKTIIYFTGFSPVLTEVTTLK